MVQTIVLHTTCSSSSSRGAAAVVAKLSNAAHCSGAATEQPAAENGAADTAASCSSCSRFQQQQQWEIKSSSAAEQLLWAACSGRSSPQQQRKVCTNKVCNVIKKYRPSWPQKKSLKKEFKKKNKYSKKGKGEGGGSSSLKLNLTDPCRTRGMLGRRAGSTVPVYAQVQCREHKTGQQKVPFYCEDKIHCRSGYSLSMPLPLTLQVFISNVEGSMYKHHFP